MASKQHEKPLYLFLTMTEKLDGDGPAQHHENSGLQDDRTSPQPVAVASLPKESWPNVWGPGHRKLYMICGLVYLCSTMNGKYKRQSDANSAH